VNGLGYIITRPAAISEDPFNVSYRNNMKQSDAESVIQVIQAEGFDSAFLHSSTYRDINDMKFHELRKAYLAARSELMDYINEAAHTKKELPYYMAEYK
jgi:hypothetical protein